jgi:hypothetical protein
MSLENGFELSAACAREKIGMKMGAQDTSALSLKVAIKSEMNFVIWMLK